MPEAARAKVFISYSSHDREAARELESRCQATHHVLRDERAIEPSADFVRRIATLINESDWFVALLTPSAVRSAWFEYEISNAIAQRLHFGKPTIVPLLWDDCSVPLTLRHIHHIDARMDRRAAIERLVRILNSSETLESRGAYEVCELLATERSALIDSLKGTTQHNVASIFWRQIQLDGDPPNADSPDDAWGRLFDAASHAGKLGTLLRLLQQLSVPQVQAIRQARGLRVLSSGDRTATIDKHHQAIARLDQKASALEGNAIPVRPSLPEYRVAVVGAFSAGKSTLINTLLERALLPENNQVSTPCPTFIHASRSGKDIVRAQLMNKSEVRCAIESALGKVGVDTTTLPGLANGDWSQVVEQVEKGANTGALGFGNSVTIKEVVVALCRAAIGNGRLLGTMQELDIEELLRLRASGPERVSYQALLKRLDVEVSSRGLARGICIIDTPGVTSQNPWHKDQAFKIVEESHALVVVEPFDSPLSKGPDELLTAFYSRIRQWRPEKRPLERGPIGTTEKIFVVLNKCDLVVAPNRTLAAKHIDETLSNVRDRYSRSWGVAPGRIFATSALTAQEEVQGSDSASLSLQGAVDMHLLEFRNFRHALSRYLASELGRQANVSRLEQLRGRIEATRQGRLLRIASLQATKAERERLMHNIETGVERLRAILETSERDFLFMARADLEQLKGSVELSLRDLGEQCSNSVRVLWKEFVADRFLFLPWVRALLSEEMARTCAATLSTWAAEMLPKSVASSVKAMELELREQLESVYRDVLQNELPGIELASTDLRLLASEGMPAVDTIRAVWTEVSDIPKWSLNLDPIAVVERWFQAFVERIIEDVEFRLPKLAEPLLRLSVAVLTQRIEVLIENLAESAGNVNAMTGHDVEEQERKVRAELTRIDELLAQGGELMSEILSD
jgi:hypothetical protein